MAFKIGKGMIQWIPGLAFLYAFYEYYEDRGLSGIQADLTAITFEGLKAKVTQIVTGVAIIVGVDLLSKYIKNLYLRAGVRALGYYIGAKQLATALRQGAGIRGGSSGARAAGYRVTAPIMRRL